jgi:hypothetical protein
MAFLKIEGETGCKKLAYREPGPDGTIFTSIAFNGDLGYPEIQANEKDVMFQELYCGKIIVRGD